MINKPVRLGLIGFGTIGQAVARAIVEEKAGRTDLKSVLVRPPHLEEARQRLRQLNLETLLTIHPDEFFQSDMSLVAEVAGHAAVKTYALRALHSGRELLICAAGALADDQLREEILEVAQQHGRQVYIPSGAIAGLDAIVSSAIAGIDHITLTTRKPPLAWRGTVAEEMVNLNEITDKPLLIFSGSARQAAKLFPQSINVAATLAYASVGLDKTVVQIYADPTVSRNVHQIQVDGVCGEFTIDISGKPSEDNPKTSALTAYSVIKTIASLTAPMVFY